MTSELDSKALEAALQTYVVSPMLTCVSDAIRAYLTALPVPPVARSGEVVTREQVKRELIAAWGSGQAQIGFSIEGALDRLYASPAPSGAPNQVRDDIGVDDGATDGHAISVNRSSAPSREAVEAAISRYYDAVEAYLKSTHLAVGPEISAIDEARAALLALYRPAGESRDDARDAKLWRWFRDRAWVGTTEDGDVCLSALCGEPSEVECFTDAERELFENDTPEEKDFPSLCQRIAEWHADAAPAAPAGETREDVVFDGFVAVDAHGRVRGGGVTAEVLAQRTAAALNDDADEYGTDKPFRAIFVQVVRAALPPPHAGEGQPKYVEQNEGHNG